MTRTIVTISVLLAVSAAFAQAPGGGRAGGAAAAAGGMPANEQIFENNDANGDGEITKAEADAAGLPLSQNWDLFDLNGDGKVVASELDTARGNLGGFGGARAGGPGGGARAGGPPGGQAPASAPADDDDDEDDEDEE